MASTRSVNVGGVEIGGGAPVVVQSMTTTKTHDVPATTAQIAALASAGCEIVRVAVPKTEEVKKILKSLEISVGSDLWSVKKVTIEEKGGDKSVITFTKVTKDAKVDDSKKQDVNEDGEIPATLMERREKVIAAARDLHSVKDVVEARLGRLSKDALGMAEAMSVERGRVSLELCVALARGEGVG